MLDRTALHIRSEWDSDKRADERSTLDGLIDQAALASAERAEIVDHAASLVKRIRRSSQPGLMESFLAEYGLSTDEGVALMCLAEALLRVPDAMTIDALIEDKIAASDWSQHLGQSSSPLVNASTWGLMLTGKVLDDHDPGIAGTLQAMVRRLGEPVIRTAVGAAMREMGRQFVLGQTINDAMSRASAQEAKGYAYSYDMLGEGAMTGPDAERYADNYANAIDAIAGACTHDDVAANPGISVKLSALHPRYEVAKIGRLEKELLPLLLTLARKAADARMGLNIDAEEADRLGLSLALIERVMQEPSLHGWDGFGVVVQAYSRRASDVIAQVYRMAAQNDRRIMVRLVKGAYWDTEIKHAQVQGLASFPVFTRKAATDVSYVACARQLLGMTDCIYPQFATHNAHTVAAVLHMAKGTPKDAYEFQRLHGMGETLHGLVKADEGTRCRVYAPVGAHRDLLAYLVRRLLENGANSSFVNQIVDESVPPETVARCPFEAVEAAHENNEPKVVDGTELFLPERINALGFDLSDVTELARIDAARQRPAKMQIGSILAGEAIGGDAEPMVNPFDGSMIGTVTMATAEDAEIAFTHAATWDLPAAQRAHVLNKAADLYEAHFGEIFSLLAHEAGKTLPDAVAELREAVDFLRYYAARGRELADPPRGVFVCISPWNFPLAIFTGQIAAALAAGNAVIAKPAETTSAIASVGVRLLHEAGVASTALQLVPGHGAHIGAALTSDPRVAGVAFTGSTVTARHIQRAMAENCAPGTPLIAETGGLNAMIVDSTALPEQAVRDIIVSAFQSAGQRCSALRCLYVQEDVAETIQTMLLGAMNELTFGDPWDHKTDIGPVITAEARNEINSYIAERAANGQLIHALAPPTAGYFVGPSLVRVDGIGDLGREVFGPVLHLATFRASELDRVIADINASGYGLTFGMHSRIDDRVQSVADAIHAGNVYINRNQIGAIVGSQPFGGEGLSGTGPKAGGPHYVARFTRREASPSDQPKPSEVRARGADPNELAEGLVRLTGQSRSATTQQMPGPTGELNSLSNLPRAPILCLGPGDAAMQQQKKRVEELGGLALAANGSLSPQHVAGLAAIGGVLWWGSEEQGRAYAKALASREGAIIPLICDGPDAAHAQLERHLCVDTTAAGGNAKLLSGQAAS
ncbi:MAG: bifunctional proline dehydrogenase/L-glutamate gamma-semialdehyde dehydrogenase PutA [Pseudomonadota bacterium]